MMLRVFIGCVALSWCHLAIAQTPPAALERPEAGEPKEGQRYYQLSCASCHGPSGRGDGRLARMLNPKPASFADAKRMAKLTDAYLIKVITHGGEAVKKSRAMPPFSRVLKPEQIRNVVAYIRTFAPKDGKSRDKE